MADLLNAITDLSEDSLVRLQKDLNYMFTHLDERNVKRLYTEYCDIRSEGGETILSGPLITMKDSSGVTRLEMGLDTSNEFKFTLYDSLGNPTITLNSTGNAEFKGTINTAEDVYIGNRLFLGWSGGTDMPTAVLSTRGMYIMEPDTTKYMAAIYSTNVSATTDQKYEFEIESSSPMNIASLERMRIYMYAGYPTINTTDYLEIWAWNNRMFLNCLATTSTSIGTMIGSDFKETFLTKSDNYQNKVVCNFDLEMDYADNLKYYYMHNVRELPATDTNPDASANCHLVSSTQIIASTLGVRIYPLTTTLTYHQIDYNLATALDFENFNDGTAMTSNDKFIIIVYISSTSILESVGPKIVVRFGNSSDAGWNFGTSDLAMTAGWNLLKQPFTPDAIEGSPVMSAVNFVRFGWYGGHSTNNYVVIDWVGVIRGDTSDANDFNPFVRLYNSTNYNQWESYWGSVMVNHNGIPAIVQAPIVAYWEWDMLVRDHVQNFEYEIVNYSMLGNYSPVLSAWINSSNYAYARVTSGVLRLSGRVDNTTFGRTINCDAFSPFQYTILKLKRNLATWTASFQISGDINTYREVTMYDGPGPTWAHICGLYLGHDDYEIGSRITSIKVKPYTE